jgi:hypothetical protein
MLTVHKILAQSGMPGRGCWSSWGACLCAVKLIRREDEVLVEVMIVPRGSFPFLPRGTSSFRS